MIAKRIIPCMDVKNGRVVKGVNFEGLNDVASPVDLAKFYSENGADELVFYDITASVEGRKIFTDILVEAAKQIFIPLTVGGGIRDIYTVARYLDAGVQRVILGTAAVSDPDFLMEAADRYGEHIAVGADLKDGYVVIRGWRETSGLTGLDFCRQMQQMGIRTLICTDIDKDGAMKGTNHELYRTLQQELALDIVASGGVSSLEDVRRLKEEGLYGAIIGKAYYTGAVDLREAIEVAK